MNCDGGIFLMCKGGDNALTTGRFPFQGALLSFHITPPTSKLLIPGACPSGAEWGAISRTRFSQDFFFLSKNGHTLKIIFILSFQKLRVGKN